MAQPNDTNIANVPATTLSGLISSLKNAVVGDSGTSSMFASLLAQTDTALPRAEPREPVAPHTAAAPVSERKTPATVSSSSDAASKADDARAASLASDQKDARAQASASSQKKNDEDQAQDRVAADDSSKPEAAAQPKTEKETAKVDGSDEEKGAAKAEKDAKTADGTDTDEAAAMLAVLVPLTEAAPKVIRESGDTSEAADKKVAALGQTDKGAEDKTDQMALNALRADLTNQQPLQQQAETKTDGSAPHGEKATAAAKAISALTQAVQGEVAAQQADKGDAVEALTNTTKSDATAETDGTVSLYSKMVDETKALSQGAAGARTSKNLEQVSENNTPSPDLAQAALAAAAQAAGRGGSSPVQAGTEKANAATTTAVQATGAAKSAATTLPLGEGVRSAGSYDFASQLSATRVTKGGAAGLPQAVEQVAVQLNKAAKDGVDEITIQLRPAELGKIEIKLEFGADKSVTGTVIADSRATLDMLQKDSNALQRALQDAGLQADAGCMQFSLRDDNSASQFARQQANSSKTSYSANDNASDEAGRVDSAIRETYYLTPGRVNLHV